MAEATKEETIQRQAKRVAAQDERIEELGAELQEALDALSQIRGELVCIGGPLNDNTLQYSEKQREPLHRIEEEARAVLVQHR